MNPHISYELADPNISSFSCMQDLTRFGDRDENGERRQYNQSSRFFKEDKKDNTPKRCSSSPENGYVYYKRQQSTEKKLSGAGERKLKQKAACPIEALSNQPKLTRSTEKLKEFLLTHADFLDSLYEKDKNVKNEQQPKDEAKSLPAELWWVPPLKLPTSRSLPSVAMSNCYSADSSTRSNVKTRRSALDLRTRVDSVCDLIEAMGILEAEQQTDLHFPTARSAEISIPLLKIPSSASQQSSRRGDEVKPHTSHKSVASQCTVFEPKLPTDDHNQNNTDTESNNAVRVASAQNASSRFENPQSSLSVSDLACIHIVNPMLSKLARLCTAQGQQYLTVLEELEKACNDFHNACKFQGATK